MIFAPTTDNTVMWRMSVMASVINIILTFVAGVILIRHGDRIGAWLVSDITEAGSPADATQIQAIAFAILGLWFLVAGVRGGASVAFTILTKPKWDEMRQFEYLWDQQKQALVACVVDLAAGVILLFGRAAIARSVRTAWRVVRPPDPDEDHPENPTT
jgi:hypothetical protein